MVSAPPPQGWEAELLSDRASKDEDFRLDPDSPIPPEDRAGFRGLSYWPPDPRYRFVGPIEVYEEPEAFTIVTTTGKSRPCQRYGRVRFSVDGRGLELQVYRLLDQRTGSLFLPFRDATSGIETYPAGRYVDLVQRPEGDWVLDFNRAHSPYCAYGMPERFVCPVTPAENRLSVRVEAGERGFTGAPAPGGPGA